MKIGYCRVSTDDQNPDLQLTALKRAGCKRIFTDKATGAHVKRPELATCLKALTTGDTLVVWKLDRLGRSLHDLIALLDELKGRGVAFRSLTESIDTTRGMRTKRVHVEHNMNPYPEHTPSTRILRRNTGTFQ